MHTITPDQLTNELKGSTVVIDVREEWEYDETNIGTLNIPLYELPHRIDEIEQHKQSKIVVFCRTGKRGVQAQKYLAKNGFKKVYNLTGGIEAFLELAN